MFHCTQRSLKIGLLSNLRVPRCFKYIALLLNDFCTADKDTTPDGCQGDLIMNIHSREPDIRSKDGSWRWRHLLESNLKPMMIVEEEVATRDGE